MTKLLNRPLKAFAFYALAILLVSIPAYVLVVDYIWVTELDENNWLTVQHTKQKLQARDFKQDEIEKINQIWGELQPGLSISRTNKALLQPDSVYQVVRLNTFDSSDAQDRFRGLKSQIELNGHSYEITIETNVEEVDETLIAVSVVTFCFFIVLILGFILLNRQIAANSWKPFYQTLNSLKSFDLSNDKKLDLPNSDIQEFQELNLSLQELVKNNLAAYQQQKSFIENASHELQTPIALLKSKLDLLIQEKEIKPEISQFLGAIEAPLSRLSRINKNLLLLAKVENQQYQEQENLNIKECIESTLILFEDYISEKNLRFTEQLDEGFTIKANSFLLETLLHNLLSNAIRHTSAGVFFTLKLENKTLTIANYGVESLDEKHLFERFSSTNKNRVSSGLGLAIIKEIATKYHWQIAYRFEEQMHIFSVIF